MNCKICGNEHGADNPCCPRCNHYNALLSGKCRDCGYEVERYKVGDTLILHSRNNDVAVISQVFVDSKGMVQVVLRESLVLDIHGNKKVGNDICRSTQSELDRYATKIS